MKISLENLFFSEPRLSLATAFRSAFRIIAFSFYFTVVITTAIFLFSDIEQLKWAGVLMVAFLFIKIININKAELSIAEIKEKEIAKGIDVSKFVSPKSLSFLERAFDKTKIFGGNFYLNLLDNLIRSQDVRIGLNRLDVNIEEFSQKVSEAIDDFAKKPRNVESDNGGQSKSEEILNQAEFLAKLAFLEALNNQGTQVEPVDLFSALGLIKDPELSRIFYLFSINTEDLSRAFIFSRFRRKFLGLNILPKVLGGFSSKRHKRISRRINRDWTARPTPFLDNFSIDLTDLAQEEQIGFLIGHEKEFERLVDILARPNSNRANALLIGEPGVGKATIVNHLAFNIIKDKVPAPLFDKRLVSLEVDALISGADPAVVSERMKKIIDEIIRAGNIILYISDIHNLFKTSGEGYMSAGDILLPILTSDAFQVVATTNPKSFKSIIEPKTDFLSVFETIRVEEISEDEAIKILIYDAMILERDFKAVISLKAIKEAVSLARKYFGQKPLPSSAQDLLREALSESLNRGDKILNAEDVIRTAEKKVNIPIHRAAEEEAETLLNLEKIIHSKLIDQDEAVSAVANALREYRSGLSRKGGPIASFLFVGPTGVGKTELSKIISEIQFGSRDAMARFDMSEYQDKQSIFRFIGSPDGKNTGTLTDIIMARPYSLILLDEFEKAHSDVLNLFLQILDDGRLTDSLGRTVDFQNTIIIATSNAHSDFIKDAIEAGKSMSDISEELKKKLTTYFRPELLNRFSNLIVFKTLSRRDIVAITKLQLQGLIKSAEDSNGIILSFDDDVILKIAEWGYDPVFGARPLRGVISDRITRVLAQMILKKEIIRGDRVKVCIEDGEVIFAKE